MQIFIFTKISDYPHLTITMNWFVGWFGLNGPLRQYFSSYRAVGWSGGAKVLGKLPVPGRPTNLDYSRARACCACSRCGLGLFEHFFSHLSLLSLFGRRSDVV